MFSVRSRDRYVPTGRLGLIFAAAPSIGEDASRDGVRREAPMDFLAAA